VVTFVVKGGTIALLAEAERIAGPIEKPPLRLESLRRASVVAIDPFVAGSTRLWRRYVRIGFGLLVIYILTGAAYLALVLGGYALAANSAILLGWTAVAAVASSVLIVWITLINFFYLMTQMVVAIEDVSVRQGVRLALTFVWGHLREVAAVFGVVLVFAVIATAASILATAGLGLIAFVPLVGLAVAKFPFDENEVEMAPEVEALLQARGIPAPSMQITRSRLTRHASTRMYRLPKGCRRSKAGRDGIGGL